MLTLALLIILFQGWCIFLAIDVINDKTAYILGLQSDKKVCKEELTEQTAEYNKLESKVKDCKRRCGE